MVGSKAGDREAREQDHAEPECRPISLLSFLQAENIRLRQAVLALSLDTMALREELKGVEGGDRVAAFRPRDRRRSRSCHVSVSAQRARVTKAGRS